MDQGTFPAGRSTATTEEETALTADTRAFVAVLGFVLPAGGLADEATVASRRAFFFVTDYGATGKAVQKDTAAFQKAIDTCHTTGGGIVRVPPGTYLLGRVHLKDNVTLDLDGGAVLRVSRDRADYPVIDGSPRSNYRPKYGENAINCRFALLYARGAKNIAVTGRGRLLGDGKSFWAVKNTGDFPKWCSVPPWHYYTPQAFRPIMMLFEECDNTLVRDITIEDSSCYAGWFASCRNMRFQNVTVLNDPAGPNTDGFHLSSCRNVHLTDCHFVCGDDCIAIDPNNDGPTGNFTITGCTFKTSVNVFRIYTGLDTGLAPNPPRGQVSDISASNCSIEDASGVFNVTADRGDIRRLTFSNFSINMDTRGSAFFFLTMGGGTIGNVMLGNMAIRTDGLGTISGDAKGLISGVTLDGLRYEACPRTKIYGNGMPDPMPSYGMHHFAPYNLYIRYARDIRLHNIQVDWGEADLADLGKVPGGRPYWSCIECNRVTGLDIDGVVCSPYGNGAPAVQLDDVKDVQVARCRAQENTEVFLRVGGASTNIRLANNDLSKAMRVYETVGSLSPKVVSEAATLTNPGR
jgi:hypothetical protein